MSAAYSIELRERVVRAYEAGEGTYPEIAEHFGVGEATAKRWVWLFHKQGHVGPRRRGGGRYSQIGVAEIRVLMRRLGDPTSTELTVQYNKSRRGRARIHVSSMKRALHRYGYVVKKNADGRWSVYARTSLPSA